MRGNNGDNVRDWRTLGRSLIRNFWTLLYIEVKHIWTNNLGQTFNDKHEAFGWLNKAKIELGELKLYCLGELRFTKTVFGIFSHYENCYIKGNLPT